ncbi:hypothetical protein [Actinomadura gamaensis]|uniref:Uncharacterized protein n=1 Tax=Actinomadura gamaensis TaxID=1763541 RepID=A0ABV9U1M7_9ACTN
MLIAGEAARHLAARLGGPVLCAHLAAEEFTFGQFYKDAPAIVRFTV